MSRPITVTVSTKITTEDDELELLGRLADDVTRQLSTSPEDAERLPLEAKSDWYWRPIYEDGRVVGLEREGHVQITVTVDWAV